LIFWTRQLESGSQTDVIYTDFAKAFDTVPHKRLLTKLEAYWISTVLSCQYNDLHDKYVYTLKTVDSNIQLQHVTSINDRCNY